VGGGCSAAAGRRKMNILIAKQINRLGSTNKLLRQIEDKSVFENMVLRIFGPRRTT